MIEDVRNTEEPELPRDQEDQIRRVAAVNCVEAVTEENLPGKDGFPKQRDAVFEQVT